MLAFLKFFSVLARPGHHQGRILEFSTGRGRSCTLWDCCARQRRTHVDMLSWTVVSGWLHVRTCADACPKNDSSHPCCCLFCWPVVHRSAASTSSASLHVHPSSHWRAFGASSAVQHADPHEKQPASSNSSSASEAATSFIVNPAGASAAPQPLQHAPTAGGVLAGPGAASLKEYSMRQVSKHADDESCWIVVNGKVCCMLWRLSCAS